MPAIQKEVTVALGTTDPNILSGSVFEFARQNALISAGVTAAATGTFVVFNSGADVVLEESPPIVRAAFPIIPDDMYYNDVAAQGDRIVISVRNPTGGGIIHRALVQITNL